MKKISSSLLSLQVFIFSISFGIYFYMHSINKNIVDQSNYHRLYELISSASLLEAVIYGTLTKTSPEPGLPILYWLSSHLGAEKIFLMATLAGIFAVMLYRSLFLLGYNSFISFCIVFLSYYPLSTMIVNERLMAAFTVFFLVNERFHTSSKKAFWISLSSILFHWTLIIGLYILFVYYFLKNFLNRLFLYFKITKSSILFMISLGSILSLFTYMATDKISAYFGTQIFAESSNYYFAFSFVFLYVLVSLMSRKPLISIMSAFPIVGLGLYMNWFGRISPFLMGLYFICLSPKMMSVDNAIRSTFVLIMLAPLVAYRLLPFWFSITSGDSYISF